MNPGYRKPPDKELLALLKEHGAELDKPLGGTSGLFRRLVPLLRFFGAMGVVQVIVILRAPSPRVLAAPLLPVDL